jgi:hypothetical protein
MRRCPAGIGFSGAVSPGNDDQALLYLSGTGFAFVSVEAIRYRRDSWLWELERDYTPAAAGGLVDRDQSSLEELSDALLPSTPPANDPGPASACGVSAVTRRELLRRRPPREGIPKAPPNKFSQCLALPSHAQLLHDFCILSAQAQ